MIVYIVTTIGSLLIMLATLSLFIYTALRASRLTHNKVLNLLMTATMQFYWSTPVGRILNRLSKDVDITDVLLPYALDQFCTHFFYAIGIFVTVAVVYPISLVTFAPIFVVFAIIVYNLRTGTRQFRRIHGAVRSKLFSDLGTTLLGLPSIRAFDAFPRFEQKFQKSADDEVNCFFHVWTMGNYIGLQFNTVVSIFTFLVSIIAISTRSGSGALGSLAISYSIRLASAFQWSIRNGIDAESYLTSVERLLEYEKCPQEDVKVKKQKKSLVFF
jgi:ABC-type bacteriocin/lantibiotic exporter with double-glycine peptidase domain